MSNDVIVGLIGPSGSGKTTVAMELEKKGYNIIQSYTTRPPRYSNEWGHTFVNKDNIIISEKDAVVYFPDRKEEMIAYVYYNNNHYWATKEQYLNQGVSIYIIDPLGMQNLKKWTAKYHNLQVIGILLWAEEDIRRKRMSQRGDLDSKIRERLYFDQAAFNVIQTDWMIDVSNMNIYMATLEAIEILRRYKICSS